MRRFEGKCALVTGAASGIGRASALRLASEGAAIHGVDLDEAGLAETAAQVQAAGGKMSASRHDLSQRDACFAAVDDALASLGRLDVLGNVAGISRFHLFEQLPEVDWNLMLAVNLSAVLWTSQAALPHLVQSQGAIVNVASVAGLIGQAYTVAYCATKGGVVQLTRALAMEYIERGVRVNAVAPGGVDTPMNARCTSPKRWTGSWSSPTRACAAWRSPRRSPRRSRTWRARKRASCTARSCRSTAVWRRADERRTSLAQRRSSAVAVGLGVRDHAGAREPLAGARRSPWTAPTPSGPDAWCGSTDERSVALGVANDSKNLYLCLVTRDLDVQTLIERLGFTLWVDPGGGTRKQIGFRVAPFQAGAKATAPAYVEIVQHGAEYGEQLVGSSAGPIDVQAAARADVIAYEIRIALGTPLSGASGLAGVTLAPGARLGLGFETEGLTSRRRGRAPVPAQQEPPPSPGPPADPRDPRYEEPEPQPLELPRARKIPPLRAWVVARAREPGRLRALGFARDMGRCAPTSFRFSPYPPRDRVERSRMIRRAQDEREKLHTR